MDNGNKIYVTKHDGTRQLFDEQKVINSILRVGVEKEKAQTILERVKSQLYQDISTQKLYQIVGQEISKEELTIPLHFYQIRETIANIDPTIFEHLVAEILKLKNYQTQWNVMVTGKCTQHQVDVIARKENKLHMVEVKHHSNPHRECGLGEVVELWGRLIDISQAQGQEGWVDFQTACLVTNSKFSDHAKNFAKCRGICLLGWRYDSVGFTAQEQGFGLEKLFEEVGKEKVIQMLQKVV